MRRRLAATALAAVTLVVAAPLTAPASATTPAAVSADDVFYPEGQEPPAVAPDDPAPEGPAGDAASDNSAPDEAAGGGVPAVADGDREAALMRGDRQAADLNGFLPSLYQGKWFMPGKEDVRKCIILRESHANYRSSNGVYHGAYQMSKALGVGATWMMQREVKKELGAAGVDMLQALRKTTPNNWNRYWQDRAFWTIWANGRGKNHWAGGHKNCF